jgi:hypothetical protein
LDPGGVGARSGQTGRRRLDLARLGRAFFFSSPDDLAVKIECFIDYDYFKATMAGPFRWTYRGKPLAA